MAVRLDSIPEEEGVQPVRLSDVPVDRPETAEGSLASDLAVIDATNTAQEVEEPGTFAYLWNRAKKGFSGFMGLPGDMLKMARSNPAAALPMPPGLKQAVGAGMQAVMPSEGTLPTGDVIATSDTYRDAFGYDPEMRTNRDLLRYAGGVTEMAAAGGPFALAAKPATLLPIVTGSVGSGIGMEAGGDVSERLGFDRQVGEAAGAVVGGVASAIVPNAARAAGGAIRNKFSPAAQKSAAESAVGREIAEQLDTYPPARGNIERSLEVSDEIPGFSPSLPARSNAPGLIAEERRIVSQSPATLNKAVQTIEANKKAIAEYVNAKFPLTGGEGVVHRVKRFIRMKGERLEGIRQAIDDKLDDATRVFESNPSNHENGNRLRELFFKQKEVYSGIRSQKYQAVYEAADKLGVKANIDDVVQYADDVLKNELNAYQASEIPPVFRQLAKDAADVPDDLKAFVAKQGGASGEVSFAKLHSLYKRANADIASLRGSSSVDRDFKMMLLEGLRSKLREKIAGFEAEGFGEVAQKLKEANRFYLQEYLPRFKQGFGSDLAARYSSGEFRTISDHVMDLIVKPRNVQGAKDFKLLFDDVPEAWDALRSGYLDKFYKMGGAVDKTGRINQRALDTFLRQHGDTLGEFPAIKKEFQQLALDNSALLARRAAVVAQEKRLAANDLFRLFQGKDPDVVLGEATTNRNAMRVLAFQARRDPNTAKALARGIAEQVSMQQDPAAFLAANEEAIRIGLRPMGGGPASSHVVDMHMKNVKTAVEAMTINSRTVPPQSVNAASVTPDHIAERFGSSPRAMISHYLNVQRGRTGAAQEATAFLGRWFDKLRRDHKVIAMEAVFYDKDTAKALANLAKNPQNEQAKLDFVTQMTSLGVRAEVAGQE